MKTFSITIGKGRNPQTLDAAKLVEGRGLIQGVSGSGKSYLARVIAEQAIPKGLQTIILDSEGEFLSLREKCDVLIAGSEGDVPCEVRSAKLLARRIAETGVSAVLDMSNLKLDERREFVKIVLDTLDGLPKKLERPRIVMLDEAHKFCPESGKGKATSTDAVITLMSQGRKRGLAGVLLTQRLSKLKKDAAAEAANVFIGKTSPIDLGSAQDMLGCAKDDREALRYLGPGNFYSTGPALDGDGDLVSFHVRKATTTHPEPGSRYKMETPAPRTVIKKLLKEFEALPPSKEAEEAATLVEATARIKALEKALAQAETGENQRWKAAGQTNILKETLNQAACDYDALHVAAAKREAVLLREIDRLRDKGGQIAKRLVETLETPTKELPALPEPTSTKRISRTSATPVPAARSRPTSRAVSPSGGAARQGTTAVGTLATWTNPVRANPRAKNGSSASSGFDRMLHALAQHTSLEKHTLAIMSGISSKTGTFRNYVSKGKVEGLWVVNGKILTITDVGIESAGEFEPLPQGSDLLDYWRGHKSVPTRAGEMLVFIASMGEDGATKEQIADHVGIQQNTGTFRNYLSRLRTLRLINRGHPIIATPELRP